MINDQLIILESIELFPSRETRDFKVELFDSYCERFRKIAEESIKVEFTNSTFFVYGSKESVSRLVEAYKGDDQIKYDRFVEQGDQFYFCLPLQEEFSGEFHKVV